MSNQALANLPWAQSLIQQPTPGGETTRKQNIRSYHSPSLYETWGRSTLSLTRGQKRLQERLSRLDEGWLGGAKSSLSFLVASHTSKPPPLCGDSAFPHVFKASKFGLAYLYIIYVCLAGWLAVYLHVYLHDIDIDVYLKNFFLRL